MTTYISMIFILSCSKLTNECMNKTTLPEFISFFLHSTLSKAIKLTKTTASRSQVDTTDTFKATLLHTSWLHVSALHEQNIVSYEHPGYQPFPDIRLDGCWAYGLLISHRLYIEYHPSGNIFGHSQPLMAAFTPMVLNFSFNPFSGTFLMLTITGCHKSPMAVTGLSSYTGPLLQTQHVIQYCVYL